MRAERRVYAVRLGDDILRSIETLEHRCISFLFFLGGEKWLGVKEEEENELIVCLLFCSSYSRVQRHSSHFSPIQYSEFLRSEARREGLEDPQRRRGYIKMGFD